MDTPLSKKPSVYRFAPSPNGRLHLGHALSAILNHDSARRENGRFLLRIEDIDRSRCTARFESDIIDDLAWLGLSWDGPARRQSDHFGYYRTVLDTLAARDLVYPAILTRGEVKARVAAFEAGGAAWPRDPDGAPLYPGTERNLSFGEKRVLLESGSPHAVRLDMARALAAIEAPLTWDETGMGPDGETGTIFADPSAWGDIVLSRSDAPSSYHLSVVLDDALQGIDRIVRGRDLFHATSVHRLLQTLLGLPQPRYHHHRLILAPDGRKLSKSNGDKAIGTLRGNGMSPDEIRALVSNAAGLGW